MANYSIPVKYIDTLSDQMMNEIFHEIITVCQHEDEKINTLSPEERTKANLRRVRNVESGQGDSTKGKRKSCELM
jgi:hypothetical protein